MQNIKQANKSATTVLLLLNLLAIVFFSFSFYGLEGNNNQLRKNTIPVKREGIYLIGSFDVVKITDGDTIHVKDESGKEDIVRFLVVNTPEIHKASPREICLGNIAKKFTQENLANKKVELYGDSTQEKRDKYDRLLAYVRLENSTSTEFFNDLLIHTGNARIYKGAPTAIKYSEYLEYADEAKAANLGLWNSSTCNMAN